MCRHHISVRYHRYSDLIDLSPQLNIPRITAALTVTDDRTQTLTAVTAVSQGLPHSGRTTIYNSQHRHYDVVAVTCLRPHVQSSASH